ncbi:hypothetical protein FQR65_LT04358 [Abscondita terminalis]|nr:hypothetical protein FQR65_LT04358 [Abscondita terminalis]
MPKAVRSTNVVPIERKENVYALEGTYPSKPTCTNRITVPRLRTKTTLTNVKNKATKETTSAVKENANVKSKSTSTLKLITSKSVSKLKPNKLGDIKKAESSTNDDNTKGKTMIAKYKGKVDGKKGSDADLVVEWDNYNNTQVFSHKTKGFVPPSSFDFTCNKNLFRVYNFSKTVKPKKVKRPLRRLTTGTDASAKIEKLKKRKLLKSQKT